MKVYAIILLTISIVMNLQGCNSSGDKFCSSLESADESSTVILNDFFDELNYSNDKETQFKKIKKYLLEQECISNVELVTGYLRTHPPIKQMFVTVVIDNLTLKKVINISVESQKLSIESISNQEDL